MKQKLTAVYNTLSQISTCGADTIRMSACLQQIQQLIHENDAPKPKKPRKGGKHDNPRTK